MQHQKFSIQFVVLRDGQPITEVLTVEGGPISLHEQHNRREVWTYQSRLLSEMIRGALNEVDGLAGVIPDHRRVGLEPVKAHPALEAVGVPMLKRLNRMLAQLINKLNGVA